MRHPLTPAWAASALLPLGTLLALASAPWRTLRSANDPARGRNRDGLLPQAVRFLAAGGMATACHYALLIGLAEAEMLAPVPASCVGYGGAAGLNYALRRRFVFRSRRPHRQAIPRYLAVAVLSGLAPAQKAVASRCGDVRSCGLEEAQHGHCPAKEEQSAAVGGDVLVVAGAKAEEVAQLVVTSAEPGG
jgi:hypothetical protein